MDQIDGTIVLSSERHKFPDDKMRRRLMMNLYVPLRTCFVTYALSLHTRQVNRKRIKYTRINVRVNTRVMLFVLKPKQ